MFGGLHCDVVLPEAKFDELASLPDKVANDHPDR